MSGQGAASAGVAVPAAGRPAVFLDRDGVLNEVLIKDGVPVPPADVTGMKLLPGVEGACRRLRELGYVLVVVTNQPDIARGTRTRADVDAMNDFLRQRLPLDDVVVCPHDDADRCACRKPNPGMLLHSAQRLGLDLGRSFCVGDRWRDVQAGQRAGVRTVYLDRGYGEQKAVGADAVASGLPEAVRFIESQRVLIETSA